MTGFTLPGMIELPGLGRGQSDFADAAARAAAEPADVVRDLEQADRDRFELPARLDHRVLRALRFKMVRRFAELDPGPLLEMAHHLCREIRVPVQAGADCGAAERELLQHLDRLFRARVARNASAARSRRIPGRAGPASRPSNGSGRS